MCSSDLRAACGAMLSAKVLRRLPLERRRNALRLWIAAAGVRVPPTSRLEAIATTLLAAREDAQPLVAWEDALVQRQADLLSLRRAALPAEALGELTWHWREASRCVLPAPYGTLALQADARGPIDLDALAPHLTLRARRGGERLRPVRGGPRRTLKRLLQEARLPRERRAHLPLIFAGERLIAAGDLWLDESVQADDTRPRRGRFVWSVPS